MKTEFITKKKVKNAIEYENVFTVFRGSVPLFWSQNDPLKPSKIWFDGTEEENNDAFHKHILKLTLSEKSEIETLPDAEIVAVDLLGHHKYESILSQMYREKCKKHNVSYVNFQLNNYTHDYELLKKTLYKKLDRILENTFKNEFESSSTSITSNETASGTTNSASSDINSDKTMEFLIQDSVSDEKEENKIGLDKNMSVTFRVNCLDCLDRTNLCQYLLFTYNNKRTNNKINHFNTVKSMWKNNGDALAQVYTGSQALKGDFAKDKKISIMSRLGDAIISANRMINNKFTDKEKQKIIENILGKNK